MDGAEQVHVLLVSWTGLGHLAPLLQLGQHLVSARVHVTAVYTARTHARLQSAGLQKPAEKAAIDVEIIPDGLSTDLSISPTFEEVLAGVPIMQDGLGQVISDHLARGTPPTCLISGTFCPWTASVAKKFGLPMVELWSSPAIIYSVGLHYDRLLSEGYVPFSGNPKETWISCIPGVPPMPASDYPKEMLMPSLSKDVDDAKIKGICSRIFETYSHARDTYRLLINSVYELESSSFDALQSNHVPAVAIGPLIIFPLRENSGNNTTLMHQPRTSTYKEDHSCLQWLDDRETGSVLFVAFGSDCTFTKEAFHELAYGLEESGQNFLWAVRPGSVNGGETCHVHDLLPEGFLESTMDRGLVVSWVPQTQVLAHPATGGFLSHCGWNSTMEALSLGVPMIACPQRADQGMNKHMMEQIWKVGISIKTNAADKILRQTISQAVRKLMLDEEGSLVKKNAVEVRDLMHKAVDVGGTSRRNLDNFIQDLINRSQSREAVSQSES